MAGPTGRGELDGRLGLRRPALGLVGGRLDPQGGHPSEQVAELLDPGRVGPEPADEAGLDALDMGQGPVREVVGAARGELALAHQGVEELTRPARQPEPAIELREAASLDVGHRPPLPRTGSTSAFVPRRFRPAPRGRHRAKVP